MDRSNKIKNYKMLVMTGKKIITRQKNIIVYYTIYGNQCQHKKFLQTTTFNIKLSKETGNSGYWWSEDLKLSIQRKNAKLTFKEILNMIILNNYHIKISICLESEKL